MERGFRIPTKEHEPDLLNGCRTATVLDHLAKHDPCALIQWEAGDAGAHRREGDRPQAALVGDLEAAAGRAAQAVGAGPSTQPHAGGVDDEAGSELAAAGDGGVTDLDRADRGALRLDRRTPGPGNRSRP